MHAAAVRRVELETELRIGIAMRQMIAHYQPIVEWRTGASSGRRRSCAGSTRSAGCCTRASSCRSPSRRA